MEEILVSLKYFFLQNLQLIVYKQHFRSGNQIVKKFVCLPLVLFKGCCKVKDFNLFRNRNNERHCSGKSLSLTIFHLYLTVNEQIIAR